MPLWFRGLVGHRDVASAQLRTPFGGLGRYCARRHASVLILLSGHGSPDRYELPDDAGVLLLRRSNDMRRGAGEIAFPGGFAEPGDRSPIDTALREAHEEVGLEAACVNPVTVLNGCFMFPYPYLVTPVIAHWASVGPVRVVDPAETSEVMHVPLACLIDPANRTAIRWSVMGFRWSMPVFQVDGMVIWGFTALVLSAIIDAAGWERPWCADGTYDVRPGTVLALRNRLRGAAL
ncbi:NUDIX hydrolase [Mycobacteroides abscessus]|uniref:NUDIX hydrolase n=1 Tax=Mycobacteroides abscessus TaxID=36809 RepID=UPI001604078D|nr:CoA pyrophosphatase [Mycobacteroides abscessus]